MFKDKTTGRIAGEAAELIQEYADKQGWLLESPESDLSLMLVDLMVYAAQNDFDFARSLKRASTIFEECYPEQEVQS